MKGMILRGLRAASDILLPRLCIVCRRRLLLQEKLLCLDCLADMPLTYFWTMSHNPMADKFNELMQNSIDSGNSVYEDYAYASALFFYHSEADYRLIPYQIKYHGNADVGRYFGRMLGKRLTSAMLFSDVDMIIPVPLHWTRKLKRGYNQAEIIASAVAEELGAPMITDIIKRHRRTATQTKVEIEDKTRNVSDAFSLNPEKIKQLTCVVNAPVHLLLIDDVFTTGSTLFACFQALRMVFPPGVRISVATLAFVGG